MFIKKKLLHVIKPLFFCFFFTIRSNQSLLDTATVVGQMVNDLNQQINDTLVLYNHHLSQAAALLDIVRQDLEKIVFEEDNTSGEVIISLPPEQAAILTGLLDEEDFPQWVKHAILSSPTVKIKKNNKNKIDIFYTAANLNDLNTLFRLKEGDHTIWVVDNILYGYDAHGCRFIQEMSGERVCIKNR